MNFSSDQILGLSILGFVLVMVVYARLRKPFSRGRFGIGRGLSMNGTPKEWLLLLLAPLIMLGIGLGILFGLNSVGIEF